MTNIAIGFLIAIATLIIGVGFVDSVGRMFRSVDPRKPPDYWPPAVRKAMRRHYH